MEKTKPKKLKLRLKKNYNSISSMNVSRVVPLQNNAKNRVDL